MTYRARVPAFLSPSWSAAFADAIRETIVEPALGDGSVVLVVGTQSAEIRIGIAVRAGAVTAVTGPEQETVEPTTIIRCDRETAFRLATGSVSAQSALAEGWLRLAGDVRGLGVIASAAPAIAVATANLRARTRFPDPGSG